MSGSVLSPLQWAVLSAYAALLPSGELRAALEAVTRQHAPQAARQRVGLTLAEAAGMMKRGHLTEFGQDAARAYLPRLNLGGQA
ncbi:hypothetical protein GO986_00090 [Deinococcus sp. HMF7620]|uniref:Uncharacterized protein n=1 Tax=Deinococcus arboris TaxID=2682977 RepID=A0A7C9I0U5_9DEIO|nr:hypothetical protein [Deinococcus arboris]MVN85171.1 hypothetical protein [Deinococcus arboris]